jgi:hypothetical protein
LEQHGAREEEIKSSVSDLYVKTAKLSSDIERAKLKDCAALEAKCQTSDDEAHRDVSISNAMQVRVNAEHFRKLEYIYSMNMLNTKEINDVRETPKFLFALFAMLCRYNAAQGGSVRFAGGHHTALHGEVFDVLRDTLGVSLELFASPLNCRWARFCSKHGDVDWLFGSIGEYRNFKPTFGSYEVNPPFDESLVLDMYEHLRTLLETSTDVRGLMFTIITPHWPNRPCWEQIARSKFCTRVEVIPLREHGYYEGAQHRKKSKYRLSSCDTAVLFLQNTHAQDKCRVTNAVVRELRHAFKPKSDAKKK